MIRPRSTRTTPAISTHQRPFPPFFPICFLIHVLHCNAIIYIFFIYYDTFWSEPNAAFDVIEHQILKTKLELYGFDGHTLGWFSSYLHNRSQYVALESSKSDEKLIGPFACPQGSCLGPLIWNLYCGEAPEILP